MEEYKVESQLSLQRAQNACVRYICNLRKYDRVSEHYLGLDWMRMDTRQNLHMLLLLFNLLRSQGPQYFQETWNYLQTGRLHSLGLLEIPRHRTRNYGDSYHISVVRLWNSLQWSFETVVLPSRRWSNEATTHMNLTEPERGREKPASHG
uniref:Uncharacterized protein n=1 Tax=Cacopsylla melanoneura TaxID=428564 RepID=A0A8D8RWM1_9HEMI